MLKSLTSVLAVVGFALAVAPAQAQTDYPAKPIKFIVPFAPGGGGDTVALTFIDEFARVLGQPVVKENHGGGNSVIGTNLVASAPADGYTMGIVTSGFVANPYLYQSLPYKHDDFTVVSMIAHYPFVLAARANFPGDTVEDIVKYAKEKPGQLSSANSGRGAGAEFATGLLGALAGIDIKNVSFQGAGPGLTAVASGFVDITFANVQSTMPFVESGKMKYIGSTGTIPLEQYGIRPLAEQGVPDYEFVQWWALLMPKGTPDEVVEKVNAAVQETMALPVVQERLSRLQATAIAGTPQAAAEYIARQDAQTIRVIEYLGLKPE